MRAHFSSARESAGEKCPGQDANLDSREEEEIELLTTGERAESVYNTKAAEAKIKYWRGAVYCLALLLFIQTCFTFWVLKSLPNWTACEIGFATDLDDAKPWISLEQTRFTNSLRADENGMLYKFSNPDDQTYTGAPSEEIEKAWDKLISGRYVRLMESEIVKLNGSAYDHPLEPVAARKHMITSSGVYGGIDVMHSLHCVNVLRKHLNSVDDLDVHLSAHYKQLHLGMFPILQTESYSILADHNICRSLYRPASSVYNVLWRFDPGYVAAGMGRQESYSSASPGANRTETHMQKFHCTKRMGRPARANVWSYIIAMTNRPIKKRLTRSLFMYHHPSVRN